MQILATFFYHEVKYHWGPAYLEMLCYSVHSVILLIMWDVNLLVLLSLYSFKLDEKVYSKLTLISLHMHIGKIIFMEIFPFQGDALNRNVFNNNSSEKIGSQCIGCELIQKTPRAVAEVLCLNNYY